jgi:hypothetical protein
MTTMRGRKLSAVLIGAAVSSVAGMANAQVIPLATGFMPDPVTASGVSGGPVQAQMVNSSCRGYIPMHAQQRVMLQTPMAFFRVWVNSAADTTLLVRAPNGQIFCADDTWGTNPGVDIQGAIPGSYEIFIGSYSPGNSQPYTVGFSEMRSSTPQNVAMAAGYGGATVVQPGVGAIAVPPQNPCGPGNPCGGAVVVAPGPIARPPMVYGGAGMPLATGFLPDPRVMSGISGGPISAQSMSPQCRGFINAVPNHTLTLTTPFNFLRVWARSQSDTTLFVRAPTGQVFCADDTYGLNPGVDLTGLPPGNYQVFVGSYSQGARAPYELGVSEMASSTPQMGIAAPAYQQPVYGQPQYGAQGTNFGAVSLTTGFLPDPQMRNGVSGGPVDAMSLNSSCRGYIDVRPDHQLYLNTAFNFLRVYVNSSQDTTLVIRGPRGEMYCADDTFGLNPSIDLQGAMPGMYQVFVGSYSAGNTAPYSIGFTELPQMHP